MKTIPFVKLSNRFFIASCVIVASIIIFSFVLRVELDIEFRGGAIITYSYDGDLDRDAFRGVAQELTATTIEVREASNMVTGIDTVMISMPGNQSMTSDQLTTLNDGLREAFPDNNIESFSTVNVNPTMGAEFLAKCLTAIALASVFMVIYVAFRFKKIGGISAGVMGVVALIHNVIIVYGVFVFFGFPISANFIAVALTILGYSLNDTIVIYDRIRENKRRLGSSFSIAELVDRSSNQCLTRSIHTTVTTTMALLVVVIVALIYNVDTILTFALPMMAGVISGAYSSLCIAGPLWVRWREYRDAKA